jgi:Ca2+-binding RTX toxin-like protein
VVGDLHQGRCWLFAAGVALLVLALPGAAWGWTSSLDSGVLTVNGEPGEVNAFVATFSGTGDTTIYDQEHAAAGAPGGCSVSPDDAVVCPSGTVARVVISAGDGNDQISTDMQNIPVAADGGDGEDLLSGSAAAETLIGGAGSDVIDGLGGADVITGGSGNDQLSGGDGSDLIDAGPGFDEIDGGIGNDQLLGGDDPDVLSGGPGDDVLSGGVGDDVLSGDDGADSMAGDDGADQLSGGAGGDVMAGGTGADQLDGGLGPNRMDGGDDNDVLVAGPDGDALDGGAGDDTVTGGDGPDALSGGAGQDRLDAGAGNDSLAGGDGNDLLLTGPGADVLAGGGGVDTADYGLSAAGVGVSLDGTANDGAPGEADNVEADIEVVLGSTQADYLTAGPASVTLRGDAGDDRLVGGPAADTLDGGDGNDVLDGGDGPDVIYGAGGTDTVDYSTREAAVTVTTAGGIDDGQAGEHDNVDSSVENVVGGAGNDRLRGARNVPNRLQGGAGDDALISYDRDGVTDELECGKGTDRVDIDGFDIITDDCETVRRDGVTIRRAPPPGHPGLTVDARGLLLGREGVVTVGMHCASNTVGRCSGHVTLTAGSSRRAYRVGIAAFRLLPGAEGGTRIRITRTRAALLRRRHPRGVHVRVVVVAHDTLGRSATVRRTVLLRYHRL